jgi:hypothetical protein
MRTSHLDASARMREPAQGVIATFFGKGLAQLSTAATS